MATAPTTTPAPTTRTSGKAVAALVLGILGIVLLPIVLSIPAIIYGKKARNEIDSSSGLNGRGLAVTGIVLGWVGIGVGVVCFALGVALGYYS